MNDALECVSAFASINFTLMIAAADVLSYDIICANAAALAATVAIPAVVLLVTNELAMYGDIKLYNIRALRYVASLVDKTPIQVKKKAFDFAVKLSGLGTNSDKFNDYVLGHALRVGMMATKTRAFQRLIKHRRSTR